MSAISVRLAYLRAARGLTQQQLAERTGLRRDTISALERGKSRAIEFDTLARLCDALGTSASDILAIAPTAHSAPILGGEDEDAIIEGRLAEAEAEIDALIANPARAVQALTIDDAASPHLAKPPVDWADLVTHLEEIARRAVATASDIDTTAFQTVLHDLVKSEDVCQAGVLIGIVAMQDGVLTITPLEVEKRQVTSAGSYR